MSAKAFDPRAVADTLEEMEFLNLSAFNEGGVGVFWSEAGGPSPWEMHPDCEEMLYVLEGGIEVEILPAGGGDGEKTLVPSGSFIVVPRGCWHRQNMLARTKELYLTPGTTQMSHQDDPRL